MRWTAPIHWLRYRWMLRQKRPSSSPLRKVGIFKPDRLGDFVLATGAIRLIVEQEGPENCILIASRFSRDLAQSQFPNVEFVEIDPWQRTLEKTREYLAAKANEPIFKRGVERLVCLRHHRDNLEALIFASIPARSTWGAQNSQLMREKGLLATPSVFSHLLRDFPSDSNEARELTRHRVVSAHFLGRSHPETDIRPHIKANHREQGKFAAVSPFGSAAIRDFPPSLLAAAANHLWNSKGIPLRILAPPGDKTRYQSLVNQLHTAGVPGVSVEECPNVCTLIDVIASSRLVLSVETATAHIAAALDRPLVALLGGGHHGWFAPWQKSHRQIWLSHFVPCFHCNWECKQPETLCITQIRPESLKIALEEAMAES